MQYSFDIRRYEYFSYTALLTLNVLFFFSFFFCNGWWNGIAARLTAQLEKYYDANGL